MKVQKAVLKETGHIAIGVLLGDVLMCAVFAIVHKFDYTVVLGALLGTAIAVANFFLLGVTLQKAVGMKEYASKYVRQSYSLRMFFCFAGVAVSVFAPCFHPIAAIIPLLMPQLVIYAMRALGLYKPDKPKETPAEAADIDSDLEGDRSHPGRHPHYGNACCQLGRDAGSDAGLHLAHTRSEGPQHLQAAGCGGKDRHHRGKLRPQQYG